MLISPFVSVALNLTQLSWHTSLTLMSWSYTCISKMRFLRQVFQKLDWTSRIDRHRQMRQNHAAFVGGKNYSPSKVWIVTPSESLTKLSRIKMLNVDWRSLRNKSAFTSVTRDISDCAAKMCKEMVGYAESFVERTASMSIARKRVCQKHLCVFLTFPGSGSLATSPSESARLLTTVMS